MATQTQYANGFTFFQVVKPTPRLSGVLPENHRLTLFEEKYTHTWERFCLDNGLATRAHEGICVAKELGFIYMTLLAQIIADSRGISPITDYPHLDRFAVFARESGYIEREKMKVAQAVLQLKLPGNLSQIGLDQIIKFRNQSDFKEKLNAFHMELDRFLSNVGDGVSPSRFVDSFNNIWQQFSGDIAMLGLGTTSFGLGTWILVNSPQTTTEAYLKEIVVGGALLAVRSGIGFRNTWKHTKTRRYTRKYLADLSRLDSAGVLGHLRA